MEVFLLHRTTAMAFAGGMTVFPGGGVDARDAETDLGWVGPPPSWWAERFRCPESTAAALVCAAVRETFEECGVLLAGPTADTVVADTSGYGPARQALVDRELSFAQFLAREGLVLRADLVRPWSNWITPEAETRRYDTRFFVAAMPQGQIADGVTTEASDAGWQRPQDAIADWQQGRRGLLPPTWSTLRELDACGDVAGVLGAERDLDPVAPRLVSDGTAVRIEFPGGDDYPVGLGRQSAQDAS
ncbi:NUDIX hydrolase [Rhodococcus sp. X156]|uniref:NUDIX hydrolase n=1 Tax=Rhodococcus sp. X156 TaxID=2499145 RepID=UPI001F497E32|nr:NUDIX hydrolase [Rhodococcus sp. X156]